MKFYPVLLLMVGCSIVGPTVSPSPTHPPDTNLCDAMCLHIGAGGLNCPEGQQVSAGDGTFMTCTQFCTYEQDNGVYVNPRCVAQAPTCADIETWRLKTCQ